MARYLQFACLSTLVFFCLMPAAVFSQQSPHGSDFDMDCLKCHSTESWQEFKTPLQFDHNTETDFELTGEHAHVTCAACHADLRFSGAHSDCQSCHIDIHQGSLGADCESCHSPESWQDRARMVEQHRQFEFALVGVHAMLDCESCHINQQHNEYTGLPLDCSGCHIEQYQNTTDPNHAETQFPTDCETCHAVQSANWLAGNFDHDQTAFSLTGRHQDIDRCGSCHGNWNDNPPMDCYSSGCHLEDFEASTNPNHPNADFPSGTSCEPCHSTAGWTPANWDHTDQTGFLIEGAHVENSCSGCHVNEVYVETPTDCYGCHVTDYETAENPNHASNQLPQDCTGCHDQNQWTPALFSHDETAFPLTGGHIDVSCQDCHEGDYTQIDSDCYGCHEVDFNEAEEPDHVGQEFSTECLDCHNTDAWDPATFDHNETDFPLTGAHIEVTCNDCHEGNYLDLALDCYSCHDVEYNESTNPSHVIQDFPITCEDCHTTDAWAPAAFDHNDTDFPLTGQHVEVTCQDCHQGDYTNTPTDCFSCHEADFNETNDPDHSAENFPTTCEVCHNADGWTPSIFDHDQTDFPLTGAHLAQPCIACHADGYTNTPANCFACHTDDYNEEHQGQGVPTTCEDCHNTSNWEETSFTHAGIVTGCYDCHMLDYQQEHAGTDTPLECEICHTTNDWDDVNFDHDADFFPIYSGEHEGEWDSCEDCHIGGNYQSFSCITVCHTNQADLADEHDDVANYVYDSQACYDCHPDGSEDDINDWQWEMAPEKTH